MNDIEPFCHLCIEEGSASNRLVRLAWSGSEVMVPRTADDGQDIYLCENCVRSIKRLSFSDIAQSIPAPKFLKMFDPDKEQDIPF